MDRTQLEKFIPVLAHKHNFRLEIVEKDYYLTLILNNIEAGLSDKLVFKGGTLLNKIHLNYHRLSEDIDFVYFGQDVLTTRAKRSKFITPVRENMPEFLQRQISTDLIPVIRVGEQFGLHNVFERFNKIMKDIL